VDETRSVLSLVHPISINSCIRLLPSRGGRFLDFLDFQPAADVKCYSKTKVEKASFLISCLPLRK
jgi:hypothetical protein